MKQRWIAGLLVGLAATGLDAGSAGALTFTCSTVTRPGITDPLGNIFRNRFEEVATNGSSDVMFISKPRDAKTRLYLFPNASAASVIATVGDAAPGGSFYKDFFNPSINDSGDLAFLSRLVLGRGLFVRPSAGVVTSVVRSGDPAPGGGTITAIPAISDVNAAGDVAFLATVSGGASGAFRYDGTLTTVSAIARIGDATGDGRQFCDITAVDVGDSGRSVLHAVTKVNCADGGEPALDGVYAQSGGGFVAVAKEGDATPIAATTFSKFIGTPEINASDVVGFRAKTTGFEHTTGLFNFDPVGPTTSVLVVVGDSAPGTGGFFRTIARPHLTNGNRQAFRGHVISGSSRDGLFLVGGTSEPVVLDTDTVPNDLFSGSAIYRRIDENYDIDDGGTKVTFTAKVRDTADLRRRSGVFRCSGA